MDPREVRQVLGALDRDEVETFADVNAAAPELAAALHLRYGCAIHVVGLDETGRPGKLSPETLGQYQRRLREAGVAPETVDIARPAETGKAYDVIASIGGFGDRHRIKGFGPFLESALHSDSRLVLDIRKGSGAYPFLKRFGACNTLQLPTDDAPGRVVMSVEPQEQGRRDWSEIATSLSGEDGFFRDLGEHSFLFIRRSDTLVVTFDNLDIAMTKRADRRPWGFGFVKAQGWSMLGVMANGWTWFRDPAVFAEFDRLRDDGFFTGFRRVVFYGASMGAYAACAFSPAAPGSTVFVTSPQSTLDKSVVPWETRYRKVWDRDFSGPYGDAAEVSRAAGVVHLLYDPYVDLDARHAARFTAPNATHWRCPLLGHRLGSSLQQMGALKEIAGAAIDGGLDHRGFYQLLRRRRDLPRYQRELIHNAIERGHAKLALAVCRQVLATRDDKAIAGLKTRLEAEIR